MKLPHHSFRNSSWKRLASYVGHKLMPRKAQPWQVAFSVFIGVAIGVFPTVGVALPLTLLACGLLRVPMGPGAIASFIAIPPTLFLFFYPAGYGLGLWLLDPPPIRFDFIERFGAIGLGNLSTEMVQLWTMASTHFVAFLVGMLLVALITAALLGFGIYFWMRHRRRTLQSMKV